MVITEQSSYFALHSIKLSKLIHRSTVKIEKNPSDIIYQNRPLHEISSAAKTGQTSDNTIFLFIAFSRLNGRH